MEVLVHVSVVDHPKVPTRLKSLVPEPAHPSAAPQSSQPGRLPCPTDPSLSAACDAAWTAKNECTLPQGASTGGNMKGVPAWHRGNSRRCFVERALGHNLCQSYRPLHTQAGGSQVGVSEPACLLMIYKCARQIPDNAVENMDVVRAFISQISLSYFHMNQFSNSGQQQCIMSQT